MVKLIHNDEDFEDEINSAQVVLVDFYADWCGPCRMIAPILVAMETELTETYPAQEDIPQLAFFKVNVDEATVLSAKLGIRAMPTFLVYKGGELKKEIVGANQAAIRTALTELLTEEAPVEQPAPEPVTA